MPSFHQPFAAESFGYKTCLIVVEKARAVRNSFVCDSRVLVGGRMNLPVPSGVGETAEAAQEQALAAARGIIDRLEGLQREA